MKSDNQAPLSIVNATRLLWLVVVIGLLNYAWEYAKPDHGMMHDPIGLVFSCMFLIGLVLFVNYQLLKARNWVRWFMVIFTLISLPGFLLPEVQNSSVNLLFAATSTTLEFAAIYLVFCSSSKAWFK